MKIIEIEPVTILKSYIRKIVLYTVENPQTYKIFPDSSIVMGFQYSGDLSLVGQSDITKLASNGITGFIDKYRIISNTANMKSILIYFTEVGAYNFFSFPIDELFNQSIPLNNILIPDKIKNVEEKLQLATSDIERVSIVQCFLISEINFSANDLIVSIAIEKIKISKGATRISEIAKELFISESTLERRFKKFVGTSPKKFAQIIRLRYAMDQIDGNKPLDELLYYDQAHFIKEFKTLTGTTPKEYQRQK